MSYKYHIITPLRRYENMEKLVTMLASRRAEWAHLEWHVIIDDDAPFYFFFRQPWIHVYYQHNPELEFWKRCNFAINRWLDTHPLVESDRYCILNDDDAYEPEFFTKIDAHEGNLVIASMQRGQHTPPGTGPTRAHATNTLVAAPENMRVGHVGVEQFFVCGEYLKTARLPLTVAGDGEMVSYLVGTYGAEYAPEANVLFNYFEPGRWDK